LRRLARGRNAEDIHAQDAVLQEFYYRIELLLILIRDRQSGIGSRKTVRMNFPVHVSGVVGIQNRHVTVGANPTLWWIVKIAPRPETPLACQLS
jgi:hypothetical protein